jgi:hypothetical protein
MEHLPKVRYIKSIKEKNILIYAELGPAEYLATITFNPADGEAELLQQFEKKSLPFQVDAVNCVSLYKNYFARQNRLPSGEKELQEPPKYLVVLESKDASVLKDLSARAEGDRKLASFKILKVFGETDKTYLE